MSACALAVQSPNSPVDILPRLLGLDLVPLLPSCTVYLVQGEGDGYLVQIFMIITQSGIKQLIGPQDLDSNEVSDATTTMSYSPIL